MHHFGRQAVKTFFKGIIVGIGGVSPGLSGSVLLIIFGLYRKTLDALSGFFKDVRGNLRFLLPLVLGMVAGVLMFSKLINFFINRYEMPTSFCFLGLILGTLPMVWREVKKEGLLPRHYGYIVLAAALGLWLFGGQVHAFEQVSDPAVWQSVLLGVAVAATAIIPGVDPAVLLTTLGLYRAYVAALAAVDLTVLGPMAVGLAAGAVAISAMMSALFRRFYTATYCVIFGIFLSMIPNMLTENCVPGFNGRTAVSALLLIAGFLVSYFLGKREKQT